MKEKAPWAPEAFFNLLPRTLVFVSVALLRIILARDWQVPVC